VSHELLRPEPPRDWRARLGDLRALVPLSTVGLLAACVGAVAAIGLSVVGYHALRQPAPVELSLPRATPPAGEPSTTSAPGPMVVYVAGAVVRPGVYPVGAGARVADAVGAAGGTTPDADVDPLNLATRLSDGDRVFVPRKGQAPPAEMGPGPTGGSPPGGATAGGPVNLNTATAEQLEALTGVGPATAHAIVTWRQQHGRFRSVQDLLQVRGIGPAKLESLRDQVTV
jgi:competence protein ComEA